MEALVNSTSRLTLASQWSGLKTHGTDGGSLQGFACPQARGVYMVKPSTMINKGCRSKRFQEVAKLRATIQPVENSAQKGFVHCTRSFFRVLESVAPMVVQMGDALRDAVQKPNTEEELQLLTALKGRMVCAAAPLLFAAISQSVNTPLTVVASGMAKWLELYSGVLMVRVLLSWFPNIPWERQPLQAMRDMCDPYLNLFRNIIPPLFNALDLSPMLAFLVLGVLTSILNTTVQAS
ncbi:unnamed protein product [Calypogeia fissa]